MITSIVLKEKHNVFLDNRGNFFINKEKYNKKEIPFFKYKEKLKDIYNAINIDRIMLKDLSSSLCFVTVSNLKNEIIKELNIKESDIGVCMSPLSNNGEQCLSALKARELMAKYVEIENVAIPTLNHEGMNGGCGCIRYFEIVGDTDRIERERVEKKEKKGKKGLPYCNF